MKILPAVVLMCLFIGSAYSGDDMMERVKAAQKAKVPLPVATPYDTDAKAKAIYLEEYTKSYRLVLAAVIIDCHMGMKGPYEQAFQDGWADGRRAAMKDHPARAAEMQGLFLEEYLRYCEREESAEKRK